MKYLIVTLPRSRSAWLSVLFSSDDSVCGHDELQHHDFDSIPFDGSVETAAYAFVDRINALKIPVLIVHRPMVDVNASLMRLGWPMMQDYPAQAITEINGLHIQYSDLDNFVLMYSAYHYLTGRELSETRYNQLQKMNIQDHAIMRYVDQEVKSWR